MHPSDPGPESDRIDPALRRARVDAFVARHFSLSGSLRLHRAALGWDLLRAPVNVALAPVFLLTRLSGLLAGALRLRRAGRWLSSRRVLLKSAVARQVETLVQDELLDPPTEAETSDQRQGILEDYTAVRSAVSEIATTLIVLATGFALFHRATPGVVSLTPMLSDQLVRWTAIGDFALGERLGALWYGLFPARPPLWYMVSVGVGLAMLASVVTTFAGVLTDPVQSALGIHRRRLLRLLARLDAADARGAPLAREHLLARAADLSDAGVSLLRIFRP